MKILEYVSQHVVSFRQSASNMYFVAIKIHLAC